MREDAYRLGLMRNEGLGRNRTADTRIFNAIRVPLEITSRTQHPDKSMRCSAIVRQTLQYSAASHLYNAASVVQTAAQIGTPSIPTSACLHGRSGAPPLPALRPKRRRTPPTARVIFSPRPGPPPLP